MMKWSHNNLMKVIIQGKEKNLSHCLFFDASGKILPNSNLFEFVRENRKINLFYHREHATEGKE